MDCSPPDSSVHEDSPDKNTGVGCHALLQGIFTIPGIKPRSPSLQVESLLSEPPCMGKLELLHWTYTDREFHSYQCLVNAHYTSFHILYPSPIHGHLFNAKELSES